MPKLHELVKLPDVQKPLLHKEFQKYSVGIRALERHLDAYGPVEYKLPHAKAIWRTLPKSNAHVYSRVALARLFLMRHATRGLPRERAAFLHDVFTPFGTNAGGGVRPASLEEKLDLVIERVEKHYREHGLAKQKGPLSLAEYRKKKGWQSEAMNELGDILHRLQAADSIEGRSSLITRMKGPMRSEHRYALNQLHEDIREVWKYFGGALLRRIASGGYREGG